MNLDYRLFLCARCLAQVAICSLCDFGQRYCAAGCTRESLLESGRRASRRYQATPRGRRFHAVRQARYRARQGNSGGAPVCVSGAVEQKVTHKGSLQASGRHTLRRTSVVRRSRRGEVPAAVLCSFCGEACEAYARRDFLRRPR